MGLYNTVASPLSPAVFAISSTVSQATSSTSEIALMTVTLNGVVTTGSPPRPVIIGLANDGNVGGGVVQVSSANGGNAVVANILACRDQNNNLIGRIHYGIVFGNTPTGIATYGVPNSMFRWVDYAPIASTQSYTIYIQCPGTGTAGNVTNLYAWALQKGV